MDTGLVDIKYLKKHESCLTEQEKIVTLLIDEVYTVNNGKYTMTDDGQLAKTVLTLMVQSTCSKYKDIISLVPVLHLKFKF